jgi:hypothetical protein
MKSLRLPFSSSDHTVATKWVAGLGDLVPWNYRIVDGKMCI